MLKGKAKDLKPGEEAARMRNMPELKGNHIEVDKTQKRLKKTGA